MSVLPLTIEPNPILHQPSCDLPLPNLADWQKLGNDMIDTMIANNGIGLAASQVGQNINLFVINKEVAKTADHLVLCNPKITFSSSLKEVMEEGCLSCPKRFGDVRRPAKVRVTAYTLDGVKHHYKVKGMLAKVFQHEIDHLRGHLIIEKFE